MAAERLVPNFPPGINLAIMGISSDTPEQWLSQTEVNPDQRVHIGCGPRALLRAEIKAINRRKLRRLSRAG
jgi:hypothetical protein